jgi:hypothetical protein
MNWIKKNALYLIGGVLGAIGGYFYWKNVGCSTNSCAITSNPYLTIGYGALLGGLFLSFFEKKKESNHSNR